MYIIVLGGRKGEMFSLEHFNKGSWDAYKYGTTETWTWLNNSWEFDISLKKVLASLDIFLSWNCWKSQIWKETSHIWLSQLW